MDRKIAIGITGASGAIYAQRLIERLTHSSIETKNIAVVLSDQGRIVYDFELGKGSVDQIPYKVYANNSYFAPFASGSSNYDCLIVVPCSMGTLGRIATGMASDLISRSADVMLKERRQLILLTRETPLNLIHLRNMTTITEAGGIICPASPSFYRKPKDLQEVIDSVVDRILSLAKISSPRFQWGEND